MTEDVKDVGKKDLRDEAHAIHTEDNLRLEESLRGYRVLYLSDKNFIKKLFNINSIRIYDKTFLNISRYGDEEFTKERNRLIRNGDYLTYAEQMKILKDRGVWSEDHEDEIAKLKEESENILEEKDRLFSKIANAESEDDAAGYRENAEELAKEISKIHDRLLELLNVQVTYFRDTIEMRAQMRQQLGWIVSSVCRDDGQAKYDNSKTLWKSIEDIESDLNQIDITQLLNECTDFWNALSRDSESFFGESPEEVTSDSDGDTQTE